MHKKAYDTIIHPKTLIIGVQTPNNRTRDIESYYDEFLNLVETSETPYDQSLFIKLRTIDTAYFFSKGKLEEIRRVCQEHQIKQILLSEPLMAQQERNLNEFLDCEIVDRTLLILHIFERSAHSAEGKTQVAIAMFQYKKSRLAGKGIHLSQQTGISGARGGAGETLKERERRHIEQAISKLKKQLVVMQKTREVQRKRRLDSHIPHFCLIGYTNAGKSTLLNILTKSSVLAEDKLFATVDTTTRELYINGRKSGIVSDTVGFIQNLPTQLIEAFKSTLSELQYADLLLHVVDIADANREEHIKTVENIIEELGVRKPVLYVFNKADEIEIDAEVQDMLDAYTPHVVVSALNKNGIAPLLDYLSSWSYGTAAAGE